MDPGSDRDPLLASPLLGYRLVGITDDEVDGSATYADLLGYAAMHKICKDEFGADARMATTKEAALREAGDDRIAWVSPTFPLESLPSSGGYVAYDAFALRVGNPNEVLVNALSDAACGRWRQHSNLHVGPISFEIGSIGTSSCGAVWPVACAAPVR